VLIVGIAKGEMPPGIHQDSLPDICGAGLGQLDVALQAAEGAHKQCKHQLERKKHPTPV
jgi:hypothetical protein